MTAKMKIATYHSLNAPEHISWAAYFLVPIKTPNKFGNAEVADEETAKHFPGPADRFGLLPYSFRAPTEEAAIEKAQIAWDTSFGRADVLRREREAREAERKAMADKVRKRSR